jgi:hypothetical protein
MGNVGLNNIQPSQRAAPFDQSNPIEQKSQSSPELPVKTETSSTDLVVGEHRFKKIGYDELKPGDIVCTYESTTTNPTILKTISLQKMIAKRSFHKMLHFEVIVEKLPRDGMYRIAHASGTQGKTVVEEENFKDYAEGQAIVAFRPVKKGDSSGLAEKISEVAEKSAEKGNKWGIKLLREKGFWNTFKSLCKSLSFRYASPRSVSDSSIHRVVQLTVDYHEKQTFLKKDGVTPREVSCVQYAANVVNVSMVSLAFESILSDKELKREEKIQVISESIKTSQIASQMLFPALFKFSNSSVNSASFIDYLASNPQEFETVGYIGSHQDTLDPDIQIFRLLSKKPVTATDLLSLWELEESLPPTKGLTAPAEVKIPPVKITGAVMAKAFHGLGLLSSSGHCILEEMKKKEKIQSAFEYLYCLSKGESPEEAQEIFSDTAVLAAFSTFSEKLANLRDLCEKPMSVSEKKEGIRAVDFEPLPPKDKLSLLAVEKNRIKAMPPSKEKNEALSLNYLEQKKTEGSERKSLGERVMSLGLLFLVLPPVSLLFFAYGAFLKWSGAKAEAFYNDWKNRIHQIKVKTQTNTLFTLRSDVGVGNRPWIHYSSDGGKTWKDEPFHLQPGSKTDWYSSLNLQNPNIQYKIFKGPDNLKDSNPMGKARGWQKTFDGGDVKVNSRELRWNKDGICLMPTCEWPQWL